MLGIFDQLVEEQINAAMQRGEFNELPGAGKPLPTEEVILVPEEMRIAYKILKNAGMIPPELATRQAVYDVEQALSAATGDSDRRKLVKKLHYLTMQLDESGQRGTNLMILESYYNKILTRLTGT